MRVLLINNFHYNRGGAEKCYFDTGKILEKNGHKVAYFATNHPKTIPSKWQKYFVSYYELEAKQSFRAKIKVIARFFYNREAKLKIKQLIEDFKPDIAHVHNIHHHLSPSILKELKRQNVSVVMTLHDYKLISPNYNLFTRGEIWEKSKPKKYYKCFFDRCVKDSYLKSLICTLEAYFHNISKVYKQIDAFISPSRFLAHKFQEFKFKPEIRIIPNCLPEDQVEKIEEKRGSGIGDYFLYFGRLAPEKGLKDIITTWSLFSDPPKLLVIGDGPEREKLVKIVKQNDLEKRIFFLGFKDHKELFNYIARAKAVLFPSRWQENYPYAILEAGCLTKILVCAKVGGFPEIIKNQEIGFLYQSKNRQELKKIIDKIEEKQLELEAELGKNIAEQIREINNENRYYNNLINIYNNLIHKKYD